MRSTENGEGRAIIRAVVVSLLFGAAGFIALTAHDGYLGVTLFIVLPAAAAFVAAWTVETFQAVVIASCVSLALALSSLLLLRLEGIVCIVMASPLILLSAFIGALFGGILRRRRPISPLIVLVFAALLLACSNRLERPLKSADRIVSVVSSIAVPGSLQEVWPAVVEIDSVFGPKPFLLRIGLPVPTSCHLEGQGVGAKRVCHFENGVIEEQISEWDPPRLLRARITESTLPGRHWLGFVDATYELQQIGPQRTRVTRITRISSTLRPGWYWKFFESLGTRSEHEYILRSLEIELETRKNSSGF